MKNELISIVITTYKRSDKVEDAIKSAINQSYKNKEIIVVDDNSEILEERVKTETIVKKYKSVKYIKNSKNLGGALSRNVGIKSAKGSLISFLDDDDIYLPNRLYEMYKVYLKHKEDNIGLIYCSCDCINDNKEIIGSYENNYNGLPLYQQMLGCIAGTSMWLTPKNVLLKVGLFEDSPCKQDSILLLKIIANGYNVYSTNKKLVLYYEHDNSKGISGIKVSNIVGLNNYRELCRKYYKKLNHRQIDDVECNFSKQLITLYVINNMQNDAKKELKNIFKRKPFNKDLYKGMLKILFRQAYLKKIGVQ